MNDKNTKNMNLLLETTWFYSTEQKKQIWSINGPIFLTVKLSGKKQSNETRLFCKDTYGKRMWFKCAIPMYYFKRIGILSENALYTPIFLHSMNCSKNHLKSLLSCKDRPVWKTCNILLNDKQIWRNRFVSISSQHSPEWIKCKKE